MKTKVNLIYLPLRLKEASARSTISLRSHIICTNTTTFLLLFLLVKGRVEVQLVDKGPWGPICGDGWGVPEAMVSQQPV